MFSVNYWSFSDVAWAPVKKNLAGNFCMKTWSQSSPFQVGISSDSAIPLVNNAACKASLTSSVLQPTPVRDCFPLITPPYHSPFLNNLVMSVMLPFQLPFLHACSIPDAHCGCTPQAKCQIMQGEGEIKAFLEILSLAKAVCNFA